MSKLRDNLIEFQKEATLKEVLQGNYDVTPDHEKLRLLGFLGDTIERGVDKMIREEIDIYNENSPTKKKSKKLLLALGIINIILGILVAYAINIEEWPFVWGLGTLMVISFFLPYILED